MKNAPTIVDTTCITLNDPAWESAMLLTKYAGLSLQTGASALEVLPPQFFLLKHKYPTHKLIVRVRSQQEQLACQNAGATAFFADASDYAQHFAQVPDSSLTIEIPVPTVQELISGQYAFSPEWKTNVCGFRVTGLSDILTADYEKVFDQLREFFGVQVSLHVADSSYCATAACLEWVLSGGGRVCASFAGACSGAALEALLAALNVLGGQRYPLRSLPELGKIYQLLSHQSLSWFQPVIGRDIFTFESGIHADGIFKNPLNYEPFQPESVGLQRKLVIGKHSGREAIRVKLRQLDIPIDDSGLPAMSEAIRAGSIRRRRSLRDNEIIHIYRNLAKRGEGYAQGKEKNPSGGYYAS